MQITYTADPSRPQLCYEDTEVGRDDIVDDSKTYKLTPTGKQLTQLIFELVEPAHKIAFQATGRVFVVDTGLGLKFSVREYEILDTIAENLENLVPSFFLNLDSEAIRQIIEGPAPATTKWWGNDDQ